MKKEYITEVYFILYTHGKFYLFILVFIFECVLQNNDFNNILAK